MNSISRLVEHPSLSILGLILGTTILSAVLAHEVISWYRLSHVPGPFEASISAWWQFKHAIGGQYHLHLKAVAEKYGKFRNAILRPGDGRDQARTRNQDPTLIGLQGRLSVLDRMNCYARIRRRSGECPL
jgi:hypothetical protein